MGAVEGKYMPDEPHCDPESARVAENMVKEDEQVSYEQEKPQSQSIEMVEVKPAEQPAKAPALMEKLAINMIAEPVGKPKAYDELKIERTHRTPIEDKENDNQEIEEVMTGYLEQEIPLPKKQTVPASEHPLRLVPSHIRESETRTKKFKVSKML